MGDSVLDGGQAVLITAGPAQQAAAAPDPSVKAGNVASAFSSAKTGGPDPQAADTNYSNYKPTNFIIINRENGVALNSLPFAGGAATGYADITNSGSTAIGSITARVYDTLGALKGSGTLVQNLPGKGNISIDMAALQSTLGVTGAASNDYARIELFPAGGEILAQARVRNGADTYNVSAAGHTGSAGMQSSASGDSFRLRFTNLTGQAIDGRGTLYSGSGSILGAENALLFAALPSKASIEFFAATLESQLGVAPWANRAWLKMTDPAGFAVQLLNTSSGVTRSLSAVKNVGITQALNYFQPAGDPNLTSMIRIYNNQRYATEFDAYLYGSDGTQLAVVSLGQVPAHGVLLVTGDQMRAKPGVPAWTGAARVKIVSDATSFYTQGSIRKNGYLTDVTGVITDGIVAHLPDNTEGLDLDLNIVNPGSQSTVLTGTLTSSTGATLGSANFALGTVASNASIRLTRANLEALAATWTGRATLTVTSSAGEVEILALLINSTTGALTNLSERPLR